MELTKDQACTTLWACRIAEKVTQAKMKTKTGRRYASALAMEAASYHWLADQILTEYPELDETHPD